MPASTAGRLKPIEKKILRAFVRRKKYYLNTPLKPTVNTLINEIK